MKKLTYFIDKGMDNYEPLFEYSPPDIDINEIYTRQLCTYFIKNGKQYTLICNEMHEDEDLLVLKENGNNYKSLTETEENYKGKGIYVEFRFVENDISSEFKLLSTVKVESHWDVLRFLLKDIVTIPEHNLMEITSTEIDEDRGCYVIYVKNI